MQARPRDQGDHRAGQPARVSRRRIPAMSQEELRILPRSFMATIKMKPNGHLFI
jgi:hypothetical protein